MSKRIPRFGNNIPASMQAQDNALRALESKPATIGDAAGIMQKGLRAAMTELTKVAEHLSEEHRKIFELQEAAFQHAINRLHERIRNLEIRQYQAIGDYPTLHLSEAPSIRQILEEMLPAVEMPPVGVPGTATAALAKAAYLDELDAAENRSMEPPSAENVPTDTEGPEGDAA